MSQRNSGISWNKHLPLFYKTLLCQKESPLSWDLVKFYKWQHICWGKKPNNNRAPHSHQTVLFAKEHCRNHSPFSHEMVMYRTLGMFIFVDVCFFFVFQLLLFSDLVFFLLLLGCCHCFQKHCCSPLPARKGQRRTIASTNHKLNIWQRPKVSQETFGFGQICLIWKTIPPQRIANKVSFVVPAAPPGLSNQGNCCVFFCSSAWDMICLFRGFGDESVHYIGRGFCVDVVQRKREKRMP